MKLQEMHDKARLERASNGKQKGFIEEVINLKRKIQYLEERLEKIEKQIVTNERFTAFQLQKYKRNKNNQPINSEPE